MGNTGPRFPPKRRLAKRPISIAFCFVHALLTIRFISEILKFSKPSQFEMRKDRTAQPLLQPLPYTLEDIHTRPYPSP